MGKNKYIETPEKLWELFVEYKRLNSELSVEGFKLFCGKTIGNIKGYFHPSTHKEFNSVVSNIKEEIFKHKLNLYKKGLIGHQKICKEAKFKGIKLDDISLFCGKTNKNQFVIENGLITINDDCLKKKRHTAKILKSDKEPDTIYVLNIEGTNIYKIGTSQSVSRRIKDICASNPFHIDIIHIQKLQNAYELEQSIHSIIDEFHVKNEWFKIKDIDIIINIIKNEK